MILALDPGPTKTAYVLISDSWRVQQASAEEDNNRVLNYLIPRHIGAVVCESMQSYGMAVGIETFDTCFWIGRFWERATLCGHPFELVRRSDVKAHLCRSSRANDGNIRQALIDRFGPGKDAAVGLKASPGPLYGVSTHAWSALAVAVTWSDAHLEAA